MSDESIYLNINTQTHAHIYILNRTPNTYLKWGEIFCKYKIKNIIEWDDRQRNPKVLL